jgi:hypothetical protein
VGARDGSRPVTETAPAPPVDVQVKLAEYERAQEMLRHYDALNWQIGAVFISANAIVLALLANRDLLELFDGQLALGILAAALLSAFSGSLLVAWWLWFRRHRDLYNFRNETLHRIEQDLGMYHFLRVVEAELPGRTDLSEAERRGLVEQLQRSRERAGHDRFEPFYKPSLHWPSGYKLARTLAFVVPALEFVTLAAFMVAVNR